MRNTTEKKITLATVKSFIRKNLDNLRIKTRSEFCGMVDGVLSNPKAQFDAADTTKYDPTNKYSLGIPGVWFVGGSRDYLTAFETPEFTGFHISNSCGSWEVAIPKK